MINFKPTTCRVCSGNGCSACDESGYVDDRTGEPCDPPAGDDSFGEWRT